MKRNLDNQGRLVIPIELKREVGLENGSEVDMELKDNKIILSNPKGMKSRNEIEEKILMATLDTVGDMSEYNKGVVDALNWVLNDSKESI